ncbi:hypothetical protein D9M71_433410 [compost metagenome]
MDHNIGGGYGGLRQENDAHRADHPGDGQHDGVRHHHVADQHGATGGGIVVVMGGDRHRLDGNRLQLHPVRGVLFALRWPVGLYRGGPCQIGVLSLLLSVFPLAGDRQCGRGHFCRGLHDRLHALAGQQRDGAVRRYHRADLVDHRGQLRRAGDYRQDRCDHGLGGDHPGSRIKRDRLVLV